MIIQIDFGMHKEYICCSIKPGKIIDELANEFDNWIHDKSIDHKYWKYYNGEKFGVCYKGDAFAYWINNCRFKETNKKCSKFYRKYLYWLEYIKVLSLVDKVLI